MSNTSYEQTHNKILESGKKLFLRDGYERSNLREICKGAGVTTGAFYRHFKDKESLFSELVAPVVQGLQSRYNVAEDKCFDFLSKGNTDDLWKVSIEVLDEFIKYIFDNFESFKLLLQCSDGTRYVGFTDWMVEREIQDTYKMYDILEQKGIPFQRLNVKELHMLTHAYYSCIFETVLHDFKEEEALQYVHTLAEFFSAGWRKVLGL